MARKKTAATYNWQTTLIGLAAGAAQIATAAAQASASGGSWKTENWIMAGAGILTGILGAAAKDGNKTGTPQ